MSDYICTLNATVERIHVRYPNRYGLMLAGDLYLAKDMDKTTPQMALIVGAPYGGVKEQGPCVYANELAQRGFVVLTFDPCYMGESEGEPRHVSSRICLPKTSAPEWIFWPSALCEPGEDRGPGDLRQRRLCAGGSSGGYPYPGGGHYQYV